AVHGGVHDAAHNAVDLAPDHAVHPHTAPAAVPFGHIGHGKGGTVHQTAAHQKDLGQHEHDQQNGDDGAAAQVLADAGDGGGGGHHADEGARHRQDGARGDDGGEGKVHGLDDGVPMGHFFFQFLVAVGH